MVEYIAVLYSISKPAKIAGKVSPIEAYRTNGSLQNCKPSMHLSRKITPFSLAIMNTSRNRKKFLMTSFSLAISGIIFMVGSTFLTSFNQEAYARNGIMEYGEIRIYLSENAAQVNELGYAGVQVNNPLNDTFMQEVSQVSGVNEIIPFERLYCTFEYNGRRDKDFIVPFTEEEFTKPVDSLSGGQKTRVSLGKLLLTKPDVLLLDEPTNHLDMNSIAWLETYLLNYPGAVLIVSHDRYFLNRVVTKVIEVEQGQLHTYMGNYSDFAVKKEQLREARLKEYLNQQREIKHQEAVIEKLRSFNREKSIKRAESREKMLDKMTLVDKPMEINTDIHLKLEPSRVSGNDVLSVKGLSKAFPPQTLFTDISFEIKRGEHIAIIGDNGTGKTTLLKILNNVIQADSGSFTLGANVEIGYYDQEHHVLHMDKTIFEEISDDYPTLTNTQIRNMLAAFLFTGDDVFKLIGDLSGGERGRVSLAKLMLSNANFLILDEPTNHLDITSKEILERALNDYTGTILYVSHDRYFINQTATRILELTGNTFVNYIGNYDYYLEKKDLLTPAVSTAASEDAPAQVSESKLSWQEQKEEQARLRKRQNDLKKTEERIGVLETRNGKIDELMMQEEVYTNSVKCQELAKEKAANEAELEELYEKWEELAE